MMIDGFPFDLEDLRLCFFVEILTCIIQVVLQLNVTFRLRHSQGKMYIGHGRVSVCVSVRSHMPTLLHGPGCNLEE